jgi:hypothetical protein
MRAERDFASVSLHDTGKLGAFVLHISTKEKLIWPMVS